MTFPDLAAVDTAWAYPNSETDLSSSKRCELFLKLLRPADLIDRCSHADREDPSILVQGKYVEIFVGPFSIWREGIERNLLWYSLSRRAHRPS